MGSFPPPICSGQKVSWLARCVAADEETSDFYCLRRRPESGGLTVAAAEVLRTRGAQPKIFDPGEVACNPPARYQPYSAKATSHRGPHLLAVLSIAGGGTIIEAVLCRLQSHPLSLPHPQHILIYTCTPRETHAVSRKDSCVPRPSLRACLVARESLSSTLAQCECGKWSQPLADTTPLIMAGLGLRGPNIDSDV